MSDQEAVSTLTADEAWARLLAGNESFRAGNARRAPSAEELAELSRGQRPFATILGCSDSRVPPEWLFDAAPGELFVIRVAGNVFSPEVAGSMQYAAAHLQTPLFVVLGHEYCGAVQAALDTLHRGAQHDSRIQILVDSIVPGLGGVDPDATDSLSRGVEQNVRWTVRQIRNTAEAQARKVEGRMRIVGVVFEIATGKLRVLNDELL
jgi:carbonic anhydrase